ncbi:MAG: hypothetical protein ABSG13_05600 [Bryobacteraceae bacterium]|jgi:hypothetical protein
MGRALAVTRCTWPLLLASATLCGQQYKADKAGPPPPEVASGISQALDPKGFQITNGGDAYCELWLRVNLPSGARSNKQNVTLPNVTLPNIPQGALLGVIRFDGQGSDRRGQRIQPGVYTLRYGIMPMNGNHEGAAPQRDFLLLTPAAEDRDLNATPNLDALVAMSRKASRTPHPAVLSFWKADADSPGFSQQSDTDWVLQCKVGDIPIAIIVVGTSAS